MDITLALIRLLSSRIHVSNGGPLNFEFGDSMPRSQDLEPIHIPTFGAVLVKCDDVIKHCSILQRDTTFIEVDDIEAIDIDTNLDFFLSENLSRHRAATSELVDVLINHTGTHPKLLDCTIRDGGYETNFEFSPEFVAAAFNACAQHGVDFFEIGFRNTLKCDGKGAWYNVSDEDIDRLWPMLDTNTSSQLAIMVTCGRFTRKDFKPRRESKIQLIRVLVHREDGEYLHLDSAVNDCKYLIGIGYEVCLNIANAESLSDEQISQVVHATVDVPQLCIYIADTFGNMCPREVEDILFRFRKIKGSSIQLGFHAHNHCAWQTQTHSCLCLWILHDRLNYWWTRQERWKRKYRVYDTLTPSTEVIGYDEVLFRALFQFCIFRSQRA